MYILGCKFLHHTKHSFYIPINTTSSFRIYFGILFLIKHLKNGEGGIRTRGGLAPPQIFEICTLNRSDTSPFIFYFYRFILAHNSRAYSIFSIKFNTEYNPNTDTITTIIFDISKTYFGNSILSKPIHRHDSPIEYIPTQIICEYIVYLNKVDGIQYSSSMKNKGTNIVLFNFNSTEIKMESIDLFHVNDLVILYGKKG